MESPVVTGCGKSSRTTYGQKIARKELGGFSKQKMEEIE